MFGHEMWTNCSTFTHISKVVYLVILVHDINDVCMWYFVCYCDVVNVWNVVYFMQLCFHSVTKQVCVYPILSIKSQDINICLVAHDTHVFLISCDLYNTVISCEAMDLCKFCRLFRWYCLTTFNSELTLSVLVHYMLMVFSYCLTIYVSFCA